MQSYSRFCPLITAFIICMLSTIALAINHFIFKFPGNNYFPSETFLVAVLLFLALQGSYLQFGGKSTPVFIMREIIYFFLVMSVIAFATNAVQFTPFKPIDEQLIAMEATAGIHIEDIIAWTMSYSWLAKILAYIYDSLPYQMSLLPLVAIFMRKFIYTREYFCLLLMSALIGFSYYYFFPTMGPASFVQSPYFSKAQYATGIKFTEIHQYVIPSTLEGGMIALPSFHAIWAWLCLYLIRWWRLIFILLLPINLLLIASCVLLGWHYPIDLLGSLLVLLLTHGLYFYLKKIKW